MPPSGFWNPRASPADERRRPAGVAGQRLAGEEVREVQRQPRPVPGHVAAVEAGEALAQPS